MSGASWFDELSVNTRTSADGDQGGLDASGWSVATGRASTTATNARGRGAGFEAGPVLLGLVALIGLALVLNPRKG